MKRFLYAFLILVSLCVFADAQGIRRAAPMATVGGGGGIAEVGSGSQRANASDSGTPLASLDVVYPGSVTSGNLLIAGMMTYNGDQPTNPTITSTCSSTFTIVDATAIDAAKRRTFIGYAMATSSGACTVTFTPASAGADPSYLTAIIDEFSGVNATPLDVDGDSSTGTSTTASDGITTVAANSLVVAMMAEVSGTGTITPAGGWTQIWEDHSWGSNLMFQVVTTATSYTASWTLSGSAEWSAQTVSFKPV